MSQKDTPSARQRQNHWERIWSASKPHEVSWYQQLSAVSLRLIEAAGIGFEDSILDVGGGASNLVDSLLDRGFRKISVLDLSESAFVHSRDRLGSRSNQVTWRVADVTTFRSKEPIDLWHDRAVLHFLTEKRDRDLYLHSLTESLAPAGHVIIAAFALDGPRKCSGLKVVRYGPREIADLFGEGFRLEETVDETHVTRGDAEQKFIFFRLRRHS